MATSAFKSTTKRTPIGTTSKTDDSVSSNRAHRRSRSLSRFSRLMPEPEAGFGEASAPRGRFVNTVRGSGFPEISLDDLAIEFFPLRNSMDEKDSYRGRSSHRSSEISPSTSSTASSQRRGRSVSRQNSRAGDGKKGLYNSSVGGRAVSNVNLRRQRSLSGVRYQISDSEIQSSALTDDEARNAQYCKNESEKTIRAVYAQKKAEHPTGDDVNSGLLEAMRKELRYAVDEIRTELEQAMVSKTSAWVSCDRLQSGNSDVLQAVSAITKNYATKLEQSEKRKQDLLAEIVLEEQRGKELSKIVRELLPESKSSIVAQRPSQAGKRSNDRKRVSKRLTEEAEKYFEDFISNVEDTDISSFDGERSDASSTLGGITKPREDATCCREIEAYQSPAGYNSVPGEMDGVILPWLQWETSHDGSSLPSNSKTQLPVTPKKLSWDAVQDVPSMPDQRSYSSSSHGSWAPPLVDGCSVYNAEENGSKSRELGRNRKSRFDMDEYLKLGSNEDLLFEKWRERHRISSGGLLLCSNVL